MRGFAPRGHHIQTAITNCAPTDQKLQIHNEGLSDRQPDERWRTVGSNITPSVDCQKSWKH